MLDRLKGKIGNRSSIQDNLIAAFVAALGGLAALKISEWTNKKITQSSADAIGVGIAVALFLAWNFRQPIRQVFGTPTPKGDRLAIYVARFNYDRDSKILQERIEKTIHKGFGSTVQVLRTVLPRPPAHSEDAESEAAVVAAAARSLLEETGGDMVIWGKLIPIGAGSGDLHFISAEDDRAGSFGFRDAMLLEANFSAELGAAITALAKVYENFAVKTFGTNIVATLVPIARRLGPLADHLPESISPDDRGFLLDACGRIQHVIGVQSGENAPFEYAIQLNMRALEFLSRDHLPVFWAKVKRQLGVALAVLGERQEGTARLTEAIVLLREALDEPAFAKDRESWAQTQSSLGTALSSLGKRNSNAETIEQAIGAFNRALEVQTPGEQPYDWAASQLMLGNALFSLALLDKGTESIERSIVTLRKALTKFTKEEAPRDWGSAKCGLGAAFALLGMRSQKADSLKNAIGEYEEALDALEPFFFEWAQAQEKRGEALLELAIMEPDAHPLEKATNALNLAIPELAGRDPDRWASAEYNLGRAHLRLGEQRHPQVLDFNFAETAFRRALSVWTSGPKHDMAIAALANVHRHLKALGHRNT